MGRLPRALRAEGKDVSVLCVVPLEIIPEIQDHRGLGQSHNSRFRGCASCEAFSTLRTLTSVCKTGDHQVRELMSLTENQDLFGLLTGWLSLEPVRVGFRKGFLS